MNKKNLFLIIGLVVLAVLAVFILTQKKAPSTEPGGEVALGEDLGEIAAPQELAKTEETNILHALETNDSLNGATMEVLGASPITPDAKVVTFEGKQTDNAVAPGSELAPKTTLSLDKGTLPETVIKVDASSQGMVPAEITAQAGAPVTIAFTSTDNEVHVFKFDDASLGAVMVGVMPGETKAMTFNAPGAGTYSFQCDHPDHRLRGTEKGVMIVK